MTSVLSCEYSFIRWINYNFKKKTIKNKMPHKIYHTHINWKERLNEVKKKDKHMKKDEEREWECFLKSCIKDGRMDHTMLHSH